MHVGAIIMVSRKSAHCMVLYIFYVYVESRVALTYIPKVLCSRTDTFM
jgi:hypothetical protein